MFYDIFTTDNYTVGVFNKEELIYFLATTPNIMYISPLSKEEAEDFIENLYEIIMSKVSESSQQDTLIEAFDLLKYYTEKFAESYL